MSKITGYKMMALKDGKLASLVTDERRYPIEIDTVIEMAGNGIWLSTKKDVVIEYYSGNTDDVEVLVEFEFDSNDIILGNTTDSEPIFTVSKAIVKSVTVVEDYELKDKLGEVLKNNKKKKLKP